MCNEETKPADTLALFKFDMEKTGQIRQLQSRVGSLFIGLIMIFALLMIENYFRIKETDNLLTRISILEKTVGNIGKHPINSELAAERARIDNLMDSVAALSIELRGVVSSNNWGVYYQRQLATFDFKDYQQNVGSLMKDVDYLQKEVRLIGTDLNFHLKHNQRNTNDTDQAEETR